MGSDAVLGPGHAAARAPHSCCCCLQISPVCVRARADATVITASSCSGSLLTSPRCSLSPLSRPHCVTASLRRLGSPCVARPAASVLAGAVLCSAVSRASCGSGAGYWQTGASAGSTARCPHAALPPRTGPTGEYRHRHTVTPSHCHWSGVTCHVSGVTLHMQ